MRKISLVYLRKINGTSQLCQVVLGTTECISFMFENLDT